MTELIVGAYITGVCISVIIYVLFILRICKSENISVIESFGFSRNPKEYTSTISMRNSKSQFVSVDQQVEQLYDQLNNLEGEERILVWNQIQELKKQKEIE